MADLNINIGGEAEGGQEFDASIELNARKSLDGNIMVFDHEDIDIVLMPTVFKIVTFPKEDMNDDVYSTQDRLFKYLSKKGVISQQTIQGGSVYGSLEAQIRQSDKVNVLEMALFLIGKFIEDEKPYFMHDKAYEKELEKYFLEPEDEDSTELGEVPSQGEKGSMPPFARYGLIYRYW